MKLRHDRTMRGMPPRRRAFAACAAAVLLAACNLAGARSNPVALPDAKLDIPRAAKPGKAVAVFAGGCFWGVEGVFEHVRGVIDATSGYSGGGALSAHYPLVGTGRTGHAESVRVTYDPEQVTYGQLLKVFFSVAHDPTEVDRQGPDVGSQYRSEVFTATKAQRDVATAYIAQLKLELQKIPESNKEARREIERRIKQLREEMSADLTFNIPSDVKLPTLYEARRGRGATEAAAAGQGSGTYQDNRRILVAIDGAQDPVAVAEAVVDALSGDSMVSQTAEVGFGDMGF